MNIFRGRALASSSTQSRPRRQAKPRMSQKPRGASQRLSGRFKKGLSRLETCPFETCVYAGRPRVLLRGWAFVLNDFGRWPKRFAFFTAAADRRLLFASKAPLCWFGT